jgi:hypothetical protein
MPPSRDNTGGNLDIDGYSIPIEFRHWRRKTDCLHRFSHRLESDELLLKPPTFPLKVVIIPSLEDSLALHSALPIMRTLANPRPAHISHQPSDNWLTMLSNAVLQIPQVLVKNTPIVEMDRNLRQSKPRLLLMGLRR